MVRDLCAEAWRGIWTHKLRSSLTMLGVGWGLFAEMMMLSLGVGLEQTMRVEFERTGPERISVYPGRYQANTQGPPKFKHVRMEPADVAEIRRHARLVNRLVPEHRLGFETVRYGATSAQADVYGLHPGVAPIRNLRTEWGRWFTPGDMNGARRVCALGATVAAQLGLDGPQAIGRRVVIRGVPLTIVGVLGAHGEQMSFNHSLDDEQAYVPLTTAERYFLGAHHDYWAVHFTPVRVDAYKQTIDEVRAIMGARQGYDPSDERTYWVNSVFEGMQFVYYLTLGLKLFLGVAGAVTVFVGGVGVMNIMAVAIAERTNEIGLRKAVGATPRQIFWQFFIEAACMTAVAAGVAFGLGLGIMAVCAQITMPRFVPAPTMSMGLALFLLALTVGVGVFAGTRPARRAARLDPADALRST